MPANLDRATKDAALKAMFGRPMYLGLAFSSIEDEDDDPAYRRQVVVVSEPFDDSAKDGKRIVTNTETVTFPYNDLDAEKDIRIAFLADDNGIRWYDNLERPRRLMRGDAIIFEPGDLKIGIP